jgi:hypothetical protein
MSDRNEIANSAHTRDDPAGNIRSVLAGLEIGDPDRFGGLTVFPLSAPSQARFRYLLLEEGLRSGQVAVREVGEHGRVPELAVVNRSEAPLLIVDGEELVGAMQNRIANLSLLVPPRRTTIIPVSCVEAGRWGHSGRDFGVTERVQFSRGRAGRLRSVQREMRMSGNRHSDQGEVWSAIERKADRMRAHSPTAAMSEIFERHGPALDQFVEKLSTLPGQMGALFAIGESEFGLDLFNRSDVFAHFFPKLVRSYAIDAIDSPRSAGPPVKSAARGFLNRLREGVFDAHPASALGHDVGIVARGAIAGALVVDGNTLHLAAFSDRVPGGGPESGTHASSGQRREQLRRRRRS